METICLGIPAYEGLSVFTHRSVIWATSHLPPGKTVVECLRGSSLLTLNFNTLWCDALNMRHDEYGEALRWFVMLHGDMGSTDPEWLNTLLAIAEEQGLDALSAVSPIKDTSGEFSTALYRAEDGVVIRLNRGDLAEWPETFSADWVAEETGQTLLVNTGMLAMRLDRAWSEQFSWRMADEIRRSPQGWFYPHTMSEDWQMSLWFRERNIPYGATRAVPVVHAGHWRWTNEVR